MCGWGHLNSFSAWGGGDLNKNFPKIQMPGDLPGVGGGGMLKLRFDWYIIRIKMSVEVYMYAHQSAWKKFTYIVTAGGTGQGYSL